MTSFSRGREAVKLRARKLLQTVLAFSFGSAFVQQLYLFFPDRGRKIQDLHILIDRFIVIDDALSSYDLISDESVSFICLMEDLFDHIGQGLIKGIPDRSSCP